MRNDRAYLIHIREAIESIEEYLENVTYPKFTSNKMIIDAVVRELEIVGEASNNLNDEFRENHPEILWRKMKNMRNFLISEYFGINTKIVWDTCKEDLPKLKSLIKDLLDQSNSN